MIMICELFDIKRKAVNLTLFESKGNLYRQTFVTDVRSKGGKT